MSGNTINNIRIDTKGQISFKNDTASSDSSAGTISTNYAAQTRYRINNIGGGAQLYVGEETVGDTVLFKLKTLKPGPGIRIEPDVDGLVISTDVHANGATNFLDLTDTPDTFSGRAGRYIAVKSDETGVEFVQPPNRRFTELTDVPGTYSGNNNRYVRVNTAGNGLEFVNLPTFSSVNAFIQLDDVPNNYSGHAGEMLVVKSDASGIEFVARPTAGVNLFTDLVDGPGSMSGQGDRYVVVNSGGTALVYRDKPNYTFLELTDSPNSYSTYTGQYVRVNSSGNGLEFVNLPTTSLQFNQLTDVPNNYSGNALKVVRVKSDETGLEFTNMSSGSTTFVGLTDTPNTFTGHANKVLRVKSTEDAVEYFTLPSIPSHLTDLVDFPGSYQASKWLRVNSGASGVEMVDLPNFSYVRNFIELSDVPTNYSGQASKWLRVKSDQTGLEFADIPAPTMTFVGLTDTPTNYSGSANKYVRVNSTADGLVYGDLPTMVSAFTDLSDAPATLTAYKYLQVNSSGTAIVLVDPPTGVTTFTGLSDTPNNYSGAAGKFVAVKADETGVEYVNQPSTTVERYTFRVNFNSSQNINTTNEGGLPAAQDFPTGWSLVSATSTSVTIQHDKTIAPLNFYISGWDSTNSRFRTRLSPSTQVEMQHYPATINQFVLTGSSLTSSGTGSSSPGYCIVSIVF